MHPVRLLHDLLPAGVVSGPANLWPREWRRAWQVAQAGDVERMAELRRIFERFGESYRFPAGKRSLAALKRGLLLRGVLSCDAVARGTKPLDTAQRASFDAAFEELRACVEQLLPAWATSTAADAEER